MEACHRHLKVPTNDTYIIFVSHKWMSSSQWDNTQHDFSKFLIELCKREISANPNSAVWVDILCIVRKTAWPYLIPRFIHRSNKVIAFAFDEGEYLTSAWCYLEFASAAVLGKAPKEIIVKDTREREPPRPVPIQLNLRFIRISHKADAMALLNALALVLRSRYESRDISTWWQGCIHMHDISRWDIFESQLELLFPWSSYARLRRLLYTILRYEVTNL